MQLPSGPFLFLDVIAVRDSGKPSWVSKRLRWFIRKHLLPSLVVASQGASPPAPAVVETELPGENNDIVYLAAVPGSAGNKINVSYIVEGKSKPLTIFVHDKTITVSLATDEEGDVTTTAAALIAAMEENEAARALVVVANAEDSTGEGVLAEMEPVYLEGGTDWERVFVGE